MSASSTSQNQSSLNSAPVGTTFGPNSGAPASTATPGMSVGSATAMGRGDHPKDNADDSNARLPSSKVGPQQEDLDGEQMRASGEGEVMGAQFDRRMPDGERREVIQAIWIDKRQSKKTAERKLRVNESKA
ncbi:hypothetical protein DID88_006360 [Monilinia fructigena]|uniref:Uncharacterized protein n=1 Tax=Monilinia fructigena TaxID=38457 RepID=A0A395J3G2_9HELO|nr:hypothetical protein DID88_006360 [Monilinia fructigena]